MTESSGLRYQKSAQWLILAIITTIPIIFGAVHPLMIGMYSFAMLVGLGGWLLLNPSKGAYEGSSLLGYAPLLFIFYIALQSVPLPLEVVDILSPSRAERVGMVNLLAGTELRYVTLSENGVAGVYKAILFLGLLFYYNSLKKLLRENPSFIRSVLLCIIFIGVFEGLYGLVQFLRPHVGILWLTLKGRAAHGTIIYKNQYASLLNMIWPLAVACCVSFWVSAKKKSSRKAKKYGPSERSIMAKTKVHAVLYVFGAGIMCIAVLFSLSRGGILSMVFVALLLTLLLPFSLKRKLYTLSGYLLFIGCYGAFLGLDTVISRFGSMGSSGAIRFDIYISSLPLLFDHWLTGIGLGSYTLLSPVYLKGFPAHIHFDRVHNEYLELFIELGIPVACVLFSCIFLGLFRIFKKILSQFKALQLNISSYIIGVGAFCGLCGFLLHGVVDFGWRLPANLVYAITLLAVIVTSLETDKKTWK